MNERALKLLDACLEAYDLYHVSKDVTGDGKPETFCNFSIHHICARMGYERFKGLMANQIIDHLRRSGEWVPVDIGKAQALANEGNLLVAGAEAQPHGHVVVIRPGLEDLSGKWNMKSPKVCHVGGKSWIGKSLSYAFPGITPPDIWMLKEAKS